jgi:hypothetical protein
MTEYSKKVFSITLTQQYNQLKPTTIRGIVCGPDHKHYVRINRNIKIKYAKDEKDNTLFESGSNVYERAMDIVVDRHGRKVFLEFRSAALQFAIFKFRNDNFYISEKSSARAIYDFKHIYHLFSNL